MQPTIRVGHPPHGAAAYGNGPLADLLLRAGARADARTVEGKVPADFARVNGHDELASVLYAAEASDEP
jgi:ankyrin repeat protein